MQGWRVVRSPREGGSWAWAWRTCSSAAACWHDEASSCAGRWKEKGTWVGEAEVRWRVSRDQSWSWMGWSRRRKGCVSSGPGAGMPSRILELSLTSPARRRVSRAARRDEGMIHTFERQAAGAAVQRVGRGEADRALDGTLGGAVVVVLEVQDDFRIGHVGRIEGIVGRAQRDRDHAERHAGCLLGPDGGGGRWLFVSTVCTWTRPRPRGR